MLENQTVIAETGIDGDTCLGRQCLEAAKYPKQNKDFLSPETMYFRQPC